MGRIRVLDPETVKLVAAGEVVDRPASVVKELVENAFDAGATQVEVVVGRELESLTVRDNGCGIAAEDVLLAFERHATSKIASSADLECIRTLGFRGEALPSIAAVARVELKTRVPEALGGTLVRVEGGQVVDFRPIGAPAGTTVVVRDLFFNTPARRKFLGSPRVEFGHVADIVTRLALGHPEIALRFTAGGREIFRTPGTGLAGAVRAIYGETVAAALVPVAAEEEGLRVTGFVGRPELARHQRRGQTWLVNGRYVKHAGLTAAVYEAYGSLLPTGKHPFFVLHLVLDPALVDVNVHPQKLAVRFDREREVLAFVRGAVKKALFGGAVLIPGAGKAARPAAAGPKELIRPLWVAARESSPAFFAKESGGAYAARLEGAGFAPGGAKSEIAAAKEEQRGAASFPVLTYLGFLPPVYLLAAGPEGLYVIDQHAAHERILFEEFSAAFSRGGIASQLLVTPVLVELRGVAPTVTGELARYGFLAEPFGGDTLLLRGVPAGLSPASGQLLLTELLELWATAEAPDGGPDFGREKAALAQLACRAAVKAGEQLAPPEAGALLERLAACREPYTCPHGRPTVICLSYGELERRFGRT